MNILITGGGTGGHLAIAKSIKTELNKRGIQPLFIGSQYGQDRAWFEEEKGFREKFFFPIQGVVNKKGVDKLYSLWHIGKFSKKAYQIIKAYSIDAVVSVGGYAAAPASFAALMSNTPLYIHEQNAIMGRLNKLLAPFAKRVFSSFIAPFDPYPVAEEFFATQRIRKELKTIIFLGGSQGAKQINDIALTLAPFLHKRGIAIIHQTGERDFLRVQKNYQKLGINAQVFAFSKNISSFFSQADLAIARAGASTLWELSANALPTLFVPYPYATNNHQYFNAKFLVDQDAALLFRSIEDTLQLLQSIQLQPLSQRLAQLTKPNGSQYIVDALLT